MDAEQRKRHEEAEIRYARAIADLYDEIRSGQADDAERERRMTKFPQRLGLKRKDGES